MATATTPRTELRWFYVLILLIALYGQSTGASSWLIPADTSPTQIALLWLLVLAFVAVLELGAVILLRRAGAQRNAGERAWVTVLTAIALAGGASALTWTAHWGATLTEQIQAFAFAGSTILGVIVWALLSDLRIDETVARYRAVEAAVRRYIKALDMNGAEKSVLIATLDVPMITRYITEGPEAVETSTGHERNTRIARILAEAIDPSTWHGHKVVEPAVETPAPVEQVRPVRERRRAQHARRTGSRAGITLDGKTAPADLTPAGQRGAEWMELDVAKRAEVVWSECASVPSAQQFADAVGCAKSTANGWIQKTLREGNGR